MSYIKTLESAIRHYHIQEFNNPSRCVPEYEQEDPEEWQTANRLWVEWMEQCWFEVATAFAGAALTESEYLGRFGYWKDRREEPGIGLLKVINKDKPRIDEQLMEMATRLGLKV